MFDFNLSKKGLPFQRYLFKGGTGVYKQEVFNEVLAYEISKLMGFNHIAYKVHRTRDGYYSMCENFIDRDSELIPASHVRQSAKKPNHLSEFEWYISSCENLGIKNAREKVFDILVLDYLIANTDRHFGNFGLIRNIERMEFKPAPIYDSGTSMYLNTANNLIGKSKYEVKPFYQDKARQIGLVDLSAYDFSKLKDVKELVLAIYGENQIMEDNDPERKFKLAEALSKRVSELVSLQG